MNSIDDFLNQFPPRGVGMNDMPPNALETYPLRAAQVIASSALVGGVTGDLQAEIGPGESVQFTFVVALARMTTDVVQFEIGVPPNPNGGFQIIGAGLCGSVFGTSYGADDFNNPVGAQRGGVPGILDGYDIHLVTGNLANGQVPGLLTLSISDASDVHVMPLTHLEVKRIGNSRQNEVGA